MTKDGKNIFPTKPFERKGAEEFIKAAKHNDYNYIREVLRDDRFYVFEYDAVKFLICINL